jgi:hypothetical protein
MAKKSAAQAPYNPLASPLAAPLAYGPQAFRPDGQPYANGVGWKPSPMPNGKKTPLRPKGN